MHPTTLMTGSDTSILWAPLAWGKVENKAGSTQVKDQLAKMDWRLLPRRMIYSNFLPLSLAFSFSLSLISSSHFVQPFSIQHTQPRSSLFIKRLFSSGRSIFHYNSSVFLCLTHTCCCCITQQLATHKLLKLLTLNWIQSNNVLFHFYCTAAAKYACHTFLSD